MTETLLAWGVVPVACTRFCEQPDLVHVGGTKDPDVAAIAALAPDLVVVDEEENRKEDADALLAAGVPVLALAVRSVADVAPQLSVLAERVGVEIGEVETGALDPTETVGERRGVRAFVPIWRRPWMTVNADTYGSSVLHALGVDNVYADSDSRYPEVTIDDVAARNVDVVLAPSEPYPFSERHRAELEVVAPVRFVDGQDLFWWGARTPAALRRLGEVVSALR